MPLNPRLRKLWEKCKLSWWMQSKNVRKADRKAGWIKGWYYIYQNMLTKDVLKTVAIDNKTSDRCCDDMLSKYKHGVPVCISEKDSYPSCLFATFAVLFWWGTSFTMLTLHERDIWRTRWCYQRRKGRRLTTPLLEEMERYSKVRLWTLVLDLKITIYSKVTNKEAPDVIPSLQNGWKVQHWASYQWTI